MPAGDEDVPDDLPPPWVALPFLKPFEPHNQGPGDAYYTLELLPFWKRLSAEQKTAWFDRWDASQDWRDCITEWFDFDAEADAIDAAEWAAAHPPPKRRWWRLF